MCAMEQDLARVEALIGEVQNLPTLPEVLVRISRMLEDPDTEISEVAEAVLRDQALTANVLRLVNSSFFARHRQIATIREAIVFLGLRTLRSLVMTTMLFRVLRWTSAKLHPRRFWEHSLATAVVASQIADSLDFGDLDSPYLGGLVHDLGLVLISQFLPQASEAIIRKVDEEGIPLLAAEKEVLGVGHNAFGAWLGRRWSFPPELVDVMYYHEEPQPGIPNAALVALVSLADIFCLSVGLGCGPVGYRCWVIDEEPSWLILKGTFPVLSRTDWVRFRMDLEGRAEEIRTLVKSMFEPESRKVYAS